MNALVTTQRSLGAGENFPAHVIGRVTLEEAQASLRDEDPTGFNLLDLVVGRLIESDQETGIKDPYTASATEAAKVYQNIFTTVQENLQKRRVSNYELKSVTF